MRTVILGILYLLATSCTNKQKRFPPETTQDIQQAIIGGADMITNIVIAERNNAPDYDTIIYELPQCHLWYTQPLPEKYKDEGIRMWPEYKRYWKDVQAINVFVANPADIPLDFGRHWHVYAWNGEKWISPEWKISMLVWEDDLFIGDKGMLLYCFRFPVGEYYYLPEGKYRIVKTFRQKEKNIELAAEFENIGLSIG